MKNGLNEYSLYVGRKLTRQRFRQRTRARKQLARIMQRALHVKQAGRQSKILEMLAGTATRSMGSSKGEIRVRVPKRFSILEDPSTVFDTLSAFARGVAGKPIQRIVFDHRELEEYDLAANALLDIIAVERDTEIRFRDAGRKLRVAGYYPKNATVKRFIQSMGIIKHMEIAHEALTGEEAEAVRIFDARNRNIFQPVDGIRADYKDIQQRKFVDHIDACLLDQQWELTAEGKHNLLTYLGEILANAEDHADYLDWSVQGYLDNSLDVPMCEIAIFNFGRSIAESMKSCEGGYTWGQISRYLDLHTKKGYFTKGWREEDLLTVIALQGNVSRCNLSELDTRGQGTVDLIEFFQGIHDVCNGTGKFARMAIVSGSTYILFDGTYRMKEREGAGNIIAFNESNSLEERPDSRYVRSLGKHKFPGTIISIKFPISLAGSTLVEEVTDDSRHDNQL
ncbi:hypothetical protein [Ralstonia wenshanensis]|uniref:hypothetical protein n=1 Tax=Ralstonia wenshanensis TaxID=2842456 RepID=UPI0021B26613|nr:hypothetical protein [Ralstonia wenshanensis]MCT7307913.1 hypothetical protein [Ralstonia wenshanensis]